MEWWVSLLPLENTSVPQHVYTGNKLLWNSSKVIVKIKDKVSAIFKLYLNLRDHMFYQHPLCRQMGPLLLEPQVQCPSFCRQKNRGSWGCGGAETSTPRASSPTRRLSRDPPVLLSRSWRDLRHQVPRFAQVQRQKEREHAMWSLKGFHGTESVTSCFRVSRDTCDKCRSQGSAPRTY